MPLPLALRVAAVAVWLAPTLTAQQRPVSEQAVLDEAARWVARLGPEDARSRAFEHLLTLGAPAAQAAAEAAAAVDAAINPARFEACMQLIEALGPEATPTLETLWAASEDAEPLILQRLLACVLTIAPHMGEGAGPQLQRVQSRLHPWIQNDEADVKERRVLAEQWFRSVQIGTMNKFELHATTPVEDLLVETQGRWQGHTFRIETAASLLPESRERSVEQNRRAVELLLAKIRAPLSRNNVSTNSLDYPCGPKSHRVFAASLLRLDPQPAEAAEAHAYLLRHGRQHERWRAIDALRGIEENVPGYEKALRDVAIDATANVDLRAEAITNLGLLPTLQPESRKALREIASGDRPGLAARASAALR